MNMIGDRFLLPPHYVDLQGLALGFMLGPIQGIHDWQTPTALAITEAVHTAWIASPRWTRPKDGFSYYDQVDWEWEHLTRASMRGAIIAWLGEEEIHDSGRCFGQTSRVELASWVREKIYHPGINLVIGIHPKFSNRRYLCYLIKRDLPGQKAHDNLLEVTEEAIAVLRNC